MRNHWWDEERRFLGPAFPLPLDRPFTGAEAARRGVSRYSLQRLVAAGLVRRLLRGVYAAAQAPDDLLLRATALGLVLSPAEVVCGRTAAWLHGVDVLPRTALRAPPPLEVVDTGDNHVRRPGVDGRRRMLLPRDVEVVHGIRVTTAHRTALDLGRLLWRYDALAALDGFVRAGVPLEGLLDDLDRFRGFRGVRQLRALAPLADGRAQSPGESALRLWWYDALLPTPQPQVLVETGASYVLVDIGDPVCRFGAEYDGEEFHTSPEDRAHDAARRSWLVEERGWTIEVFTKHHVYDPGADPVARLQEGHERARRTHRRWSPGRRSA
ncbi:type IV toxin-antitoxin system AbiEi family antitoxin domain-containing protein [Nocardioides aurantiacus]|uniref:type IV toxin-antitoxin system AbiEi family antitoxin domain-containing protein n=1 Tax=Nocardioides aurantiacus TaxID=86796 RepID=UPI00403F3029